MKVQMNNKKLSSLWLGLTFLSFLFVSALYLDLDIYANKLPSDFNEAVELQVRAAKYPNVSVLVFDKNGVLFSKQVGYANIETQQLATDETLYQIASVSKMVTGTAVMRLVEQGLLSLDEDINKYLPFKVVNPSYPNEPISVRMLLSHVSSISDSPAYLESYTLGVSAEPTESLESFLKAYFKYGGQYYDKSNFQKFKPGSSVHYSNVGFALLGYLVERISGISFNEYCDKEIFKPLEMLHTTWFYKNMTLDLAAMPYGYSALKKRHEPLGFYSFSTYPDGALKTSTVEFMKFLNLFVNEGRTLSGNKFLEPSTVKEMLKLQYPEVSNIPGLAWAHIDDKHMHGGSEPGVDSWVLISESQQWGVIMFANSGGLPAWRAELGLEIRDYIFDYISHYGIAKFK